MPTVYIVRCVDGTLYTGYAVDLGQRLAAHNAGRGARYTAGRRPVTVVYSEECASISDALKREHALKQLPRAAKCALIAQHSAPRAPHSAPRPAHSTVPPPRRATRGPRSTRAQVR